MPKKIRIYYRIFKRMADFMAALLGILFLLPLFILISVAIKLDSKGPILFKQKRVGKFKKHFNILKFRTMRMDTPKDVPTHELEDPLKWITPVGKFLRKTSLDELPQLFNVLKGDMAVIGPRPALYNQYDLIELRDQYGVNRIRPGITGMAQSHGRDELPIPKKVAYDKSYFDLESPILDIKILGKTFLNAITAKGVVEGKTHQDKSN